MFVLLLLQVASASPDIALDARVTARSLSVERKGEARLTLRTEPDGGNTIDVRAPQADSGTRLANVDVELHAAARIAGQTAAEAQITGTTKPD